MNNSVTIGLHFVLASTSAIISSMSSIPKNADYFRILTDKECEIFCNHKFGECFKPARKKFCSKTGEVKNLRKVAKSF